MNGHPVCVPIDTAVAATIIFVIANLPHTRESFALRRDIRLYRAKQPASLSVSQSVESATIHRMEQFMSSSCSNIYIYNIKRLSRRRFVKPSNV